MEAKSEHELSSDRLPFVAMVMTTLRYFFRWLIDDCSGVGWYTNLGFRTREGASTMAAEGKEASGHSPLAVRRNTKYD